MSKAGTQETAQRLHQNTVAAVLEALETIFGKGIYADKVLERLLKSNRKWGARDRGFVAETTYDMVRWWRKLWALYEREPILKRKELWTLFGIYWRIQGHRLPDWDKLDGARELELHPDRIKGNIALEESFPDWLNQRAEEQLGPRWPGIAHELNALAPVVLRTNTLSVNREQLQEALASEGIPTHPFSGNEVGLILDKRMNTFRSNAFQNGWFEVQDGGSQLIAPFVGAEPGMRVIDACAGAGGKTLHLAALMQNKGSLLAMDVEAWKLQELKKRARRNGVHNLETRPIEGTKTIKRLLGTADRVLLDVPCSGTGVIKRNPDTKWKLSEEHLESVIRTQAEILALYSGMAKPGGEVVYATCSIFPAENQDQVKRFLEEHPNFEFLEDRTVSPSSEGTDGFYMARLKRLS